MSHAVFILGGAKSGKTSLALRLAESWPGNPVYLATAQARDPEMAVRIKRHQAERGPRWSTLEEPLELCGALERLDTPEQVVLVDCLTLWLSNLMTLAELGEAEVQARCRELAELLPRLKSRVILVANEVGLGIVPDNPLARSYRDQAGALHQSLARACQAVYLVAAGLPLALKGPGLNLE